MILRPFAGASLLCDLKPSGRYVTTELHAAGGIPQVMKMLLEHGLLHGDALTISGQTVTEVLSVIPPEPRKDQSVIHSWSNPVYAQGHLAILKGNLATEGAVAKVTGVKHPVITGPARVFDSEEECLKAILDGAIKCGDVIVIRYEGPRGGPGMREMLAPTSAIIGAGLGFCITQSYVHHRALIAQAAFNLTVSVSLDAVLPGTPILNATERTRVMATLNAGDLRGAKAIYNAACERANGLGRNP